MINEMPMHGERQLPVITLRQEDLPEIPRWQIGGKYYIVMKVEMVAVDKQYYLPDKSDNGKLEARFEVESVRALDNKPVDIKTLEKKAWDKTVAKIKSGEY